jgi:hypothetical protein
VFGVVVLSLIVLGAGDVFNKTFVDFVETRGEIIGGRSMGS